MSDVVTTPSTNVPTLPPPRRIVLSHDPQTGAPVTVDKPIDMMTGPVGQRFGVAYTQQDFIGRPELAVEGASRKPDNGFIQTTGISAGFIGTSAQRGGRYGAERLQKSRQVRSGSLISAILSVRRLWSGYLLWILGFWASKTRLLTRDL